MKGKLSHIVTEIVIVVIGLLIALQLDRWRDSIKQAHREKEMLIELKASLQFDLIDLESNLNAHTRAIHFHDSVKLLLNEKTYDPRIGAWVFRILREYSINFNTSAYQSLKGEGLNLISNDSLRIKLVQLYEFDYGHLIKTEEHYRIGQFYDKYYQMVLNNFSEWDYDFPGTPDHFRVLAKSKPRDFELLKKNNEFLILLNQAELHHRFIRMYYLIAMRKTKSLIGEIERSVN